MKIKVQCPCGARFEFEVTPVNGRMPVAINCPTCGTDATELANDVIQQQSPPPPAAAPNPPAPPPVARLSISKGHAPSVAPAAQPASDADSAETGAAPVGVPCPKHKSEMAVENCCVCGKPICLKCMEQFGYVCSVYCRQQATQKHIHVPVYALQKSVVEGKSHVLFKRVAYAISTLLVIVPIFWIWYAWFARDYRIVYSVQIPKTIPNAGLDEPAPGFYQLIGPGQLLSIKDKQLALFDVAQQKQIWSAPLRNEADTARSIQRAIQNKTGVRIISDNFGPRDARETAWLLNDYLSENPTVIATTNDVWVSFPDHLARFDRQTGSPKEAGIKDKITSVTASDDAILVISGNPGAGETLNRISLPDGNLQSEVLTTPAPVQVANPTKATNKITAGKTIKPDASVNKIPIGQIKNLAAPGGPTSEPADDSASDEYDPAAHPFIADGSSVMQFETKVLEHKTISHVAMKAKGASVLDSGNVTADSGLDLAQEMANDSRREATGGVEIEDVSRYQITLHRHFAEGILDWTGEVVGPPRFYALKTVDVICAGQTIYVFDKSNKKLWQATLTFSVANRFSGDPCLETKDALYFADLGMLTRFDLLTGNVRWRYNSVGISKLLADARGALYVDTTTAGPESIQYSQQINIKDKIHPVLVKLDPATGREFWNLRSVGDTCYVSGKFLYSTLASTAMAALHLEEGPDRHYYLNLLDPANGKDIWSQSFHRGNEHIIKTEFQKNWILVQFREEVLVLKFFSL